MARMLKVVVLPLALLALTSVAAAAEAPTVTTVSGFSLSKPQDAVALGGSDIAIADTDGDAVLWRRSGMTRTLTGLAKPSSVAPAPDGGLYIANTQGHEVLHVPPGGAPVRVAGTGSRGSLLEDVLPTLTPLEEPEDVLAWNKGFLVADRKNGRLLRVKEDKKIKILASGLDLPTDLARSEDGVLIAEAGGGRLLEWRDDRVSTLLAGLSEPTGVAVLPDGRHLIAEQAANRILVWNRATDDRSYVSTGLLTPRDVSVGLDGTILVADRDNNRIARVTLAPLPTLTPQSTPEPTAEPTLEPVEALGPAVVPALLPALPVPNAAGARRASAGDLPPAAPPEAGERLLSEPVRGTVRVKLPGETGYVELDVAASIPTGAVVDTRRGAVALTAAQDASGATATATFSGGTFRVLQSDAARPVTELRLQGGSFAGCRARGTRAVAAGRSPRRVWGDGHGRFRTRGRDGAATVRGTHWLTEDTCAGTRVRVRRGAVAVEDFGRDRTIIVRAGGQYLARHRESR